MTRGKSKDMTGGAGKGDSNKVEITIELQVDIDPTQAVIFGEDWCYRTAKVYAVKSALNFASVAVLYPIMLVSTNIFAEYLPEPLKSGFRIFSGLGYIALSYKPLMNASRDITVVIDNLIGYRVEKAYERETGRKGKNLIRILD